MLLVYGQWMAVLRGRIIISSIVIKRIYLLMLSCISLSAVTAIVSASENIIGLKYYPNKNVVVRCG